MAEMEELTSCLRMALMPGTTCLASTISKQGKRESLLSKGLLCSDTVSSSPSPAEGMEAEAVAAAAAAGTEAEAEEAMVQNLSET